MNTTEWINNRYGTNFNEEDLASVKDFSLLWNVFEKEICGNNFSIPTLQQDLANRNLNLDLFQEQIDYFKNRYVSNGGFTPRFGHLNFRPNDRQQLVEEVLLGVNNNPNDIILAAAIIVYRFRNNLFHGIKNIPNIDQQRENFETANRFLMTYIDN